MIEWMWSIISSICLIIAGLWHVCHLFLLFSPLRRVCIPLFLRLVEVNRPWRDEWMIERMNGWMKWCFMMPFTICNTLWIWVRTFFFPFFSKSRCRSQMHTQGYVNLKKKKTPHFITLHIFQKYSCLKLGIFPNWGKPCYGNFQLNFKIAT